MFKKCVFITLLLFMATGLYIVGECRSYLPYVRIVWAEYSTALLVFGGILFSDITCVVYLLGRWLLLQETGRKLVHYEKQLSTGDSVSAELVRLLQERK